MLKTKKQILKIAPYVAGKSKISGVKEPIKLSSNENPLGCSPKAMLAYSNIKSLSRYPDSTAASLRAAIGKSQGQDPERIICGAGSDEILELIAYAYAGNENDEVIYTEHGFLVYPIAAQSAGATPIKVKEKNYTTDISTILKAVTKKTRIVYLANPNNPTGTYIPKQDMVKLRKGLREDILLVIDSAYAECVTAKDYTDGREIADKSPNTIVTHTFSKMYGLAALRLGWAYAAPEIIDILNRIRPPFNITGPTIAAGIEAIKDKTFLQKSIAHNTIWREKLTVELKTYGYTPIKSQGNFVLSYFGNGKKAAEFFASKGIIVREVSSYGLPEFLRISIGTENEMKKLFQAIRQYKK